MPYNSLTDRTAVDKFIPEDVAAAVIEDATQASVVMQLARRLNDMPRNTLTMKVLDANPTAYFVNGDTGLKQTTDMAWANVVLTAEELAVVVPIPENVLDDSEYDIWGAIRPKLVEAFGRAIDAAVLHGTNKPASWPSDIVAGATAASNVVDLSANAAATPSLDLYDSILGVGGVDDLVAQDGYIPNARVAALSMMAQMRGLRDANGVPIFNRDPAMTSRYELDGIPTYFPRNGALNTAAALLITGDWSQLVYSVRQDITFKMFDQGVVQDNAGAIQLNLMQQDAVALRAKMRIGFALPQPASLIGGAGRYPFAVLVP